MQNQKENAFMPSIPCINPIHLHISSFLIHSFITRKQTKQTLFYHDYNVNSEKVWRVESLVGRTQHFVLCFLYTSIILWFDYTYFNTYFKWVAEKILIEYDLFPPMKSLYK